MREIVFDVETTGLRPNDGDRVCEIAGVELIDYVPSGQVFHEYVNPMMPMPAKAQEIHGLSDEFLSDKGEFESIADRWLGFIGDAKLIAHNAMFDFGFVNAELARCDRAKMSFERMIDTVAIARRKFPGSDNSLDALCNRFGIDLSARTKHNALLDTQLLAEVYVELIGARQKTLGLDDPRRKARSQSNVSVVRHRTQPPLITEDERKKHAAFIETLGGDPVWRRYIEPETTQKG
ncbi:MAG: DNA polymerase III subunit epsilon [Pseudomonadota bacterium]